MSEPLDPNNIDHFSLICMILVALEAGEISEGQAVRLTGHGAVMLRAMRLSCIAAVQARWKNLKESGRE